MATKILIMGLSGAGKTTLAAELMTQLYNAGVTCAWFNADDIRRAADDWDFSTEGRMRQADRMRVLAEDADSDFVICDFVAPLEEMRTLFDPTWIIWVDTVKESEYKDTDSAFVPPSNWHFRVTEKDAKKWSESIALTITAGREYSWKPTIEAL